MERSSPVRQLDTFIAASGRVAKPAGSLVNIRGTPTAGPPET
jgi:hypothetical protein